MLFNSHSFLLAFLPGAIVVYAVINRYPRLRIPCLLVFSLLFYGYWNPRFIAVLAASILINWLAARAYAASKRSAIISAAGLDPSASLMAPDTRTGSPPTHTPPFKLKLGKAGAPVVVQSPPVVAQTSA